ncbi:MAG: guanylate kinase [Desulfovibrio sp.]|nr:guanylate kinase [Desulfovibrio sp.]
MRQGIALVLSAPSGTGKSTLCRMLRREFPDFGYSISCTTRPMRAGEENGREYFFLSRPDFERMRETGEFAEWAQVHGHLYGTPLAPVKSMLESGVNVLFDIDVQGAAQLKTTLPDATFVFILPPDMRELRRRLESRGMDDETSIQLRLQNALAEIREAFWYNSIIVNDTLENAYAELRAVFIAARLAPAHNMKILENILEDAEKFHA